MIITIVLLIGLVVILGYAVRTRMSNNRFRMEQGDIIDSPMTEAIGQLLGIAGGIYLSLIMVMSFLGIDQPQHVEFLHLNLDPLALIAIILAVVQPLVIHWVRKIIH